MDLKVFGLLLPDSKAEVQRAKKIQRLFLTLKQTFPIFSGALTDYNVNYLLELDFLKRLCSESTLRVGLSPKSKARLTTKFGGGEKLPYSHGMYEYL
jgi:hypothetical protein